MKLFIWNNPYSVSYGGSCLYVLANNLSEARKLALSSQDASFGGPWKEKKVGIDVSKKKPDRIITKPYAEVYHWEE